MKFVEFLKNVFTKNIPWKLLAIGLAFVVAIIVGAAGGV